ncbi:hypothetical protein OK351_10105 [Glutamicibacter sp. MNS18]|uniref:hypothetical protein n=1 Tax=Glutamicibacter sp. MNS18 TaxID=2989817 RepID=UPI00223676BF|nr:hypothetical protein [Glutamicibacter sp. MNS18]MCW4465857.1 hypothetical protein [Glutamicibacter sp. MNS18]
MQPTRSPWVSVDPTPFLSDSGNHYFTSPSGNLYCGILHDGTQLLAGCQALSIVGNLPECDDPMVLSGPMISLVDDGTVGAGCTSEGVYVGEAGKVLGYGERITVGAIRCSSLEDGVTCEDLEKGAKFLASRAAFTQIP